MLKPELNKALGELMDASDWLFIRWVTGFNDLLEVSFGYRGHRYVWAAGFTWDEMDRLRRSVCESLKGDLPPFFAILLNALITDTYYHYFGITE